MAWRCASSVHWSFFKPAVYNTDEGGPPYKHFTRYISNQLYGGPVLNGGPERTRMVRGKAANDDRV